MSEVFDLDVCYFSDATVKGKMDKGFGKIIKWDMPLLDGYRYRFLKNYSRSISMDNHLFDAINFGIFRDVKRSDSKIVIINGWSYFSNFLVIFAAKLFGKKVWLRAESPLNQEILKSKKAIAIKKIVLGKLLFPFISKFLYIGTQNKNFYHYYGIPDQQLIYTPYAVDNDFFFSEWQRYKPQTEELKKNLGIPPGKKIILFTGKFIDKKRPMDLLKAFQQLNDASCFLVMVGEGTLREKMESFIKSHALQNVMLTGFINQSKIPQYYAIADIFVMCSGVGETWGLSVNEAMNFEKPVLVSRTCGCCSDLVEEGINGYSFEEGNVEQLSALLYKSLSAKQFLLTAGKKSKEIINRFSVDEITTNIFNILSH
jgi:glycosyltransferase involved in cell wall biosynthesis